MCSNMPLSVYMPASSVLSLCTHVFPCADVVLQRCDAGLSLPEVLQGVDSNIVGDTLSSWAEKLRPATSPLSEQAAHGKGSSRPAQGELSKEPAAQDIKP